MDSIVRILGQTAEGVDIELNEDGTIHIETPRWRIAVTDKEYREFAATVLAAALALETRAAETRAGTSA